MASFHNSANNLLHPAHHDGSQLLSDDTSDYVPGPDVDEDNIIVINSTDISDIDTPVVGLKHGCASSDIRTWFTNNANSHLKSATCKYCNLHINHHKKSEVAKLHLNKCSMFCKLMNSMEDCNHPDWFIQNKEKDKTVASLSNTPSFSHQTSINQYALPKLSIKQKQELQKNMAMLHYATGTSFQYIKEFHLKDAIKVLRPDDSLLPNRKQLSSTLLNKFHQVVLTKVKTCMKGSTCCLTTDGWSNVKNDPVVNYMAVSPEYSFSLELVMTGQQQHNHKYLAEDIARVIYSKRYWSSLLTARILSSCSIINMLLRHSYRSCRRPPIPKQ